MPSLSSRFPALCGAASAMGGVADGLPCLAAAVCGGGVAATAAAAVFGAAADVCGVAADDRGDAVAIFEAAADCGAAPAP